MKHLKKETPHLFLRLNNFENYNFIEEHKKVMDKYGYVWLLKIGKTINQEFVKKVIAEKGGIILKSSVKDGNKFYYCDLLSNEVPENDKELIYPNYYNEFFEYEAYNLEDLKKSGYWFKIANMREITEDDVYNFRICKGHKPMLDCALYSRVVHMYVENRNETDI